MDDPEGGAVEPHAGAFIRDPPGERSDPIPVPANDDAGRAIQLYCDLIARSAIDGISRASGDSGIDLGAAETPVVETALAEPTAAEGQSFELLTAPRGAPDDFMQLTGMGPEIVQKLNSEIVRIIREPEVKAKLDRQGLVLAGGPPEELGKLISAEIKRWKGVASSHSSARHKGSAASRS